MSQSSITITVKLFAAYQEAYSSPELTLEFPLPTSAIAVLDYLLTQQPQLEPLRHLTRFGVNLQFVDANTLLQDGDELVLIPPVSGG
jgi:molybdopterin synthase sulfur carrier subunit